MAARDQTTRRLAAAIASNAYRADPERRVQRRRGDEAVPADVVEQYRDEVDPKRKLTDEERAKRVGAAWRRDEARRLLEDHRARLASFGDDAA